MISLYNPGFSHVGEHLHRGRVVVGEEQALPLVQLADGRHVLAAQGEVEHVDVLLHALLVGGLGDDHHIALQQKPQGHLGGGFTVFLTNLHQDGVGEEILPPFGKGTPALMLHMVLLHVLMGRLLLLEHMGFHLVHSGGHLHKLTQVDEPVRVEVGHPNGPQFSGLIGLLHGPPAGARTFSGPGPPLPRCHSGWRYR